jgi:hypothetical protein
MTASNLRSNAATEELDLYDVSTRPPWQLRASFWLWLVAVAAGVFETTLVVIDATTGQVGSAAEMVGGITVRLLAFTGLVYLAARLRQGRNWARIALAVRVGDPVARDRTSHLARRRRIASERHGSRGFRLCAVRGQPTRTRQRDHCGADLDVPPGCQLLYPSNATGVDQ